MIHTGPPTSYTIPLYCTFALPLLLSSSQIADFGMSRDLDDNDYYVSNGGKIPIKWTAPEVYGYLLYFRVTILLTGLN
jgi:hypothetical protein